MTGWFWDEARVKRFWEWFDSQKKQPFPVYASFDIRVNDNKIAIVDANLFPAGFNNIHVEDWDRASEAWRQTLDPWVKPGQALLLLTEEHTLNLRYWDHVFVLKQLLQKHFKVWLIWPRVVLKSSSVTSANHGTLTVYGAHPEQPAWQNESIGLILSNNDFSADYGNWFEAWKDVPLIPPPSCGWRLRHKANFFHWYNQLSQEAARILDIDPYRLQIETLSIQIPLGDDDAMVTVAEAIRQFSQNLYRTYQIRGWQYSDTIFLKNARGTYGLGVLPIENASQFQNFNYHQRKKLKAAKANWVTQDFILQEAVATHLTHNDGLKEPVLYYVGRNCVGGFWRVFGQSHQSLVSFNAPGAYFIPEKRASLLSHPALPIVGALGILALERECEAQMGPCLD